MRCVCIGEGKEIMRERERERERESVLHVFHSLSSGLCALSVDNDNGFIAYPGSSQVSHQLLQCMCYGVSITHI